MSSRQSLALDARDSNLCIRIEGKQGPPAPVAPSPSASAYTGATDAEGDGATGAGRETTTYAQTVFLAQPVDWRGLSTEARTIRDRAAAIAQVRCWLRRTSEPAPRRGGTPPPGRTCRSPRQQQPCTISRRCSRIVRASRDRSPSAKRRGCCLRVRERPSGAVRDSPLHVAGVGAARYSHAADERVRTSERWMGRR